MILKDQIKTIAWNINPFVSFNEKKISGKSIILIYHGIVPQDHLRFNYRFITINNFQQQLKLIKKKWNIVTVEDIYNNRIDTDSLNVAITFDDGYRNNYSYAAGILTEQNVPASFYITTIAMADYAYLWADFLDIFSKYSGGKIIIEGKTFTKYRYEYMHNGVSLKNYCRTAPWSFKINMFNACTAGEKYLQMEENRDYWQLMNEDQIKTLSDNPLFTIGGHGMYHNNLASIPIEDASNELIRSKHYLENITGKKIEELAYPDGSYNNNLVEIAMQAGYNRQLLVSYNNNDNQQHPAIKERFGVNPYLNPLNQVKYISRGKY